MNLTGQTLIQLLKEHSRNNHKILLPGQYDEGIADNVAFWANNEGIGQEDINQMVETFCRISDITLSLEKFANSIQDIYEKVRIEKESKEKFYKILEKTKKRMEQS